MQHSFDINIAKQYGIEEAIILNNLYYWIEKNKANGKHYYDDTYWTYNSKKAFIELFPYMNERKIDYALNNLIKNNLIKSGNYNQNKLDRTLWYAITKNGYCILQNCEMENTKLQNEVDNIIYNNNIYNTNINKQIKTTNNKENIKKIFDFWNSKKIIEHRELTEPITKAIKQALKEYSEEQIKSAIDNYNIVIKDKNYYFDTIWSLDKFLKQKNAMVDFLSESGTKWLNYTKKNTKEQKSENNDYLSKLLKSTEV